MSGNANLSVCGGVGRLAMIMLLAYTMIMFHDGIVAIMNVSQTYTVKYIQKGRTLLNAGLPFNQSEVYGCR